MAGRAGRRSSKRRRLSIAKYAAPLKGGGIGKSLRHFKSDKTRIGTPLRGGLLMRGRKTALIVRLTDAQRRELESWLRRTKTAVGLARRAKAILSLDSGQGFVVTARSVGLRERHVRKWAKRFLEKGLEGLSDKKGRGRKPVFSPRGSDPPCEAGM